MFPDELNITGWVRPFPQYLLCFHRFSMAYHFRVSLRRRCQTHIISSASLLVRSELEQNSKARHSSFKGRRSCVFLIMVFVTETVTLDRDPHALACSGTPPS